MPRVSAELSAVRTTRVETIASGIRAVETAGEGFFEITREVMNFLKQTKAHDGVVLLYLRHTSASLVIQENADPEVQTDLIAALKRIAPENAGWVHDVEGPDDMPAHIKAMVIGVALHLSVWNGKMALGTWQGIYLAEHRARPHRREVIIQFLGGCDEI